RRPHERDPGRAPPPPPRGRRRRAPPPPALDRRDRCGAPQHRLRACVPIARRAPTNRPHLSVPATAGARHRNISSTTGASGRAAAMVFEVSTIRLPPILRPEAGGKREVEVEATTIEGALKQLVDAYPSLQDRVFDGGELP